MKKGLTLSFHLQKGLFLRGLDKNKKKLYGPKKRRKSAVSLIDLQTALFRKRRHLFRLLQVGSIILIPAALLSISSRYLRLRIIPGDTMACGGYVCSKNTLCALNILYCVSKTSFLKKAFFLFCVALIDTRSKMEGTYLKP